MKIKVTFKSWKTILIYGFFFGCFLTCKSQLCFAQFRDTISFKDTTHSLSSIDYALSKKDSSLQIGDVALQFLAAEAAFNITSFSLFGDSFYRGLGGFGGGIGIFLSYFTVPLAIHFTTKLLQLKTGSWGWAAVGACGTSLLAGGLFLLNSKMYITRYISVSLPIISFSILIYDLTIP